MFTTDVYKRQSQDLAPLFSFIHTYTLSYTILCLTRHHPIKSRQAEDKMATDTLDTLVKGTYIRSRHDVDTLVVVATLHFPSHLTYFPLTYFPSRGNFLLLYHMLATQTTTIQAHQSQLILLYDDMTYIKHGQPITTLRAGP